MGNSAFSSHDYCPEDMGIIYFVIPEKNSEKAFVCMTTLTVLIGKSYSQSLEEETKTQ